MRPPRRWRRGGGYVPRIKGLPQIKIRPQRGLPSLEPRFVRITRTDAGINVDMVLDGVCKQLLPPSESAAGSDPGVADQLATSDGERIRGVDDTQHRKATRERSRAVSRSKKGGKARRKQHVSKRNACHRKPARPVRKHGTLVGEDLAVETMTRSAKGTAEAPGTNVKQKAGPQRSIPSQARGLLPGQLACKAGWAGRRSEQVHPAHTSQRCHRCAEADGSNRKGTRCGCSGDADVNAVINVLPTPNSPAAAANRGNGRGAARNRPSQQ